MIAMILATHALWAQQKKRKLAPLTIPSATTVIKKPLTHEVYDGWKEIPESIISPDGSTVFYTLNPQEGDGRLMIHSLKNTKIDSVQRAIDVKVSDDSEFAFFRIKPPINVVKAAKKLKRKKEDMPKDSLGIFKLKSNFFTKVPNLISYKIPEKSGRWLAFQIESVSKNEPIIKKDSITISNSKKKVSKKENEENGYTLVLKDLTNQTEYIFEYVTEYEFNKYGNALIFSTTGSGDTNKVAGIYRYDLATNTIVNIFSKKGSYKKITITDDATQIAFVADLDTNKKTQLRLPKLYYWKISQREAQLLADESQTFAPKGWLVSEYYSPRFSKDGTKLFFGTNPKPILPDTTILPEDIVNVEVWNWQDKILQTQQKVTLEEDKKRSYLAMVNLDNLKIIQLGFLEIPTVLLDKDANHSLVLATTNLPYSNQHWDWNAKKDVYLINLTNGSRKKIATGLIGNPVLSPKAHYLTWWSEPDTAWFAYEIATEKTIKLTNNIAVKFYDEQDDHPDFPPSYGFAGWIDDEKEPMFVVYDRYDAWAIDLKNNQPMKITGGREHKIVYRYVKLALEEKYILQKSPFWTLFYEESKQEGYAVPTGPHFSYPKAVLKESFKLSNPIKAKYNDTLIFTKQNFQHFPDIYTSTLSFEKVQKISDANPQQREYLWGSVELVSWKANDSTALKGLLYKPENFDASKKYPMMVYYYERNSDNLNNYIAPTPIRSYINYSYFTSNGYIVFVPDIVYKIGEPGQSAYNCLIPGVEHLINKGFINKERIGISGHSWGGYQTAYLVTQTNLFRAAEAGAPVSNMTSAYGGIRWETGLSRQAQYEKTQTRMGGTLWSMLDKYIQNSPIFHAPKVMTPLLMMHNDADGAVPWYQGIEFYMALKRLDKPVWLLNYNDEKHGLTLRKNRKDFTKRLYQFFDFYLKDNPAPLWMTEGLPMIEKGINQKLELENK